jgi:ketosteroid isomerase-like protein
MRKAVLCLSMLFVGMMCFTSSSFAATPEDEIMQADRDFNTATQQKRADGWMTYFAENAVVPAMPPLAGKAALNEHFQKLFANRDFILSWEPVKAEVFPGDKMGYTVGKYLARFKDKAGQAMEETGRYITIWKKQDDGSWKIVADTGSEDGPARATK